MLLLLAIFFYIAIVAALNFFNMLFIGNIHHVNPELLPALGYSDTFSLFLPIYLAGTLGLIKAVRD